jgi:hypothetical protein
MIIYDLHVIGVPISPFKADTPPIIDADAILPCSIPSQFFQAICWRDTQIIQRCGTVQHTQFAQGNLLNIMRQLPGTLTGENLLSFFTLESPDHSQNYITQCVKRQTL